MFFYIFPLSPVVLTGEYTPEHLLSPKDIADEYKISNTSTQLLLLRLAGEGLIKILPIRERVWPNNAAINEYRVADLNIRQRMLSSKQGVFIADISQQHILAHMETEVLKVLYADAEVASLLNVVEGDRVIYHRTLQKRDQSTIVAIADTYFPFWFAEMLPELENPEVDAAALMTQMGRIPDWCTETVDVVQATSVERIKFGMSPDDPSALLKILRRTFDKQGNPLILDFLTDRGDTYRLHYSFPFYRDGVPEALRDK